MSTFLELCKSYRAELGIPGTGPVTVVGQIGELARVVLDIQDADQDIKRQWQNWNFMWKAFATKTVIDAAWLTLLKPSDLGTWDTNSFWIEKGTANAAQLTYIDYDEWRNVQEVGEVFSGEPTEFTILPNGEVRVYPTPEQAYDLTASYWCSAGRLASDSDISIVPAEYHRIIQVRAKMIYAEREDAPEIMSGSSAEYYNLMTNLEAAYLQGQGDGKQSRVVRPRTVRVE